MPLKVAPFLIAVVSWKVALGGTLKSVEVKTLHREFPLWILSTMALSLVDNVSVSLPPIFWICSFAIQDQQREMLQQKNIQRWSLHQGSKLPFFHGIPSACHTQKNTTNRKRNAKIMNLDQWDFSNLQCPILEKIQHSPSDLLLSVSPF